MKLKTLLQTSQDLVTRAEKAETKEEVLSLLTQLNDLLRTVFKEYQIVKRMPRKTDSVRVV